MTNADWVAVEDSLFRLAAAAIRSFAASSNESFYGFAFDCEGEYGDLKLVLNSEEHLRECVRSAAADPLYVLRFLNRATLEQRLQSAPTFNLPTPSPDEIERELRWSPGSWKCKGIESDDFRLSWAPFADEVLEARHEEPDWTAVKTETQERFLRAVCRVLVRLEREGTLDVLDRTMYFRGFVRDQWDSENEAWERLADVRSEFI